MHSTHSGGGVIHIHVMSCHSCHVVKFILYLLDTRTQDKNLFHLLHTKNIKICIRLLQKYLEVFVSSSPLLITVYIPFSTLV